MDTTPNPTPNLSTLNTPTMMSPEQFRDFISQATPEQRAMMAGMLTPSAGPSGTTTAVPTPTMQSPPSRRSSNRSRQYRSRRSGGGGGCCGGDDAITPPRERPTLDSTASTPRSVGSRSSSRRFSSTPQPHDDRRAYTCVDGVVVMDDVGADMKTRIRQITHTVFAHEVMTKFPRLSQGKKDRVVQQILAEYHPREGSEVVPNKWIMDQMKACLSHRRSDVTQAIKKGAPKPWYLDQQEWDKEVEAHGENPQRYAQQERAAARRLESVGSSHLGSGGWDSFHAYFVSILFSR